MDRRRYGVALGQRANGRHPRVLLHAHRQRRSDDRFLRAVPARLQRKAARLARRLLHAAAGGEVHRELDSSPAANALE